VEQIEVLVEVFRSNAGAWESRSHTNLDSDVALESAGATIPLREIYRLVFC
jgi:hypothetical protein